MRKFQGWVIALFEKERIALFLLKIVKEQFALFALFLLFLLRAKEQVVLLALFMKSKGANCTQLLLLSKQNRAKSEEQKNKCLLKGTHSKTKLY